MKQNLDSNYNFLLTGAATNVGRVRKANEDSMVSFETANFKVFVVCDGMGGHVGGQIASQTAITVIRDFLTNNMMLDPREAIYDSIIAANDAILSRANQQPELAGMGSTCVMLIVTSDGKAYYGHVGDSRIYIIANHKITQLTEDHSVVYELFKAGILKSREEMERHPRKNEITNALGLSGMQPPTICDIPIEPESGNCFLLCSDGLTGMVNDEQIRRVVNKHEISIQQRAETLIQKANENGGVDNITVALVEYALGAQQINGSGKKTGNRKKQLFCLLAALIVLGGLVCYFKDIPSKEVHQQFITLKDSVEYKSDKWVSLGVAIKAAEVDSVYRQFVTIKGIAQNFTDISFQWTEKDFSGNKIKVLCTADSMIYHITIPVKHLAKEMSIPSVLENPASTIEKPQTNKTEYLKIESDTVWLEFQTIRTIKFTDFMEAKNIKLKNSGKITSSKEEMKVIGKVEGNSVNVKWIKGDMPPQEVVFTVQGNDETTYVITLHFKKLESKKTKGQPRKEQEENSKNPPTMV